MGNEDARLLLQSLVGVLIFAGAVMTFINGRLNEAKTANARSRVVTLTLVWLSILASILAGLSLFALKTPYAAIALFGVALALQAAVFLRKSGPVSRSEIVAACFTTLSFAVTLIALPLLDTIGRIVGVLERMISSSPK